MLKTWRLPESELVYTEFRNTHLEEFASGCLICPIPTKREIGSFRIIANEFPYDAVSAVNDMLALKEHAPCLTVEQLVELEAIKRLLGAERFYDLILENLPKKKTIPGHYHIHLMKLTKGGESHE